MASTDANDLIYYLNASRNYDPSPHLDKITAPVLWINSADDYINPPELGIAEKMVKRMPNARFILIAHLRRHARPRNPYRRRGVEGLPGGVHAGHGAEALQ